MTADRTPEGPDGLARALQLAEQSAAGPDKLGAVQTAEIRSVLQRVELGTPLGAPLHAQLDNVRRWLDALDRPADHDRFGGIEHLRKHVVTQLQLARGALEDYRRSSG
ncbi:MAG TPA: hypothetical protein VM076_17895 [Gemmatimonadaceae bacterium]|nr:hypothetical protein [Gemmatimonadaceae bacterium]